MPIKLDLSGKKFGKLSVIQMDYKTPHHVYWKCVCDCGKETSTRAGNLLSGKSKSCGCGNLEQRRHQALKLKELNKKNPVDVAENHTYLYYKKGAKKRNLEFLLSRDDVIALINMPCHYCGDTPNNNHRVIRFDGDVIVKQGGIDRVDNSKGYSIENCVPCCKICNSAKGTMTPTQFYSWIEKVYRIKSVQIAN